MTDVTPEQRAQWDREAAQEAAQELERIADTAAYLAEMRARYGDDWDVEIRD